MLSIKNFKKVYPNGKIGAQDVNIDVIAGDIYAFIGPNGSGKTTTIKSVVGALNFEHGEIHVDGLCVKSNPIECKKIIGYIPDQPDVYNTLTGMQYLNFVCSIYGVKEPKKSELIKKYAQRFNIENDLGTPISAYSHGMRQKIILTSVLVREPKLLILDEPFVGLDPKASFTLKEIMKEFTKNGGAIFYSTHVLDVAEKLCNKVAIIKESRIIANGTMEEVKKNNSLEEVFLSLE